MTSNIDAYKNYIAPNPPGKYFKLDDGKSAKIRVASECFVYYDQYLGKMSTRYAWVVWNFTDELAQVWQASATSFKAVQALAVDEEWGDPMEYNLNIAREGVGKETKYSITPSPNRQALSKEAQEAVDNFDLLETVEGAIPLSQVVEKGDEPEPPKSPSIPDKVVTEVPDGPVNLDDIPPF